MNAKTLPGVRLEPRRLPTLVTDYPKAVSCLRDNLDELLTWWRYKSSPSANRSGPPTPSKAAFAKSDRRTQPIGRFSDRTSMVRILFAVFNHEDLYQASPSLSC